MFYRIGWPALSKIPQAIVFDAASSFLIGCQCQKDQMKKMLLSRFRLIAF
jgi:hypothetical protein